MTCILGCAITWCLLSVAMCSGEERRPRARDLGIPFPGTAGSNNAITDVPGVEVGYATLNRDSGKSAVRTGVTAILPRGKGSLAPAFAAWSSLNGTGEMTGTHLLDETGVLIGPVMITNTISVGMVRDASIRWQFELADGRGYRPNPVPVVAETWDGVLNDIMGQHITHSDVFAALNSAAGGPLAEGNVGGGTGMSCFGFKCGTGTSSRAVDGGYTVGAIVQANHGARERLIIAGIPVGAELSKSAREATGERSQKNSIVVVLASDAPLLPHQLKALAKRATIGVGRTGGIGEFYSGDLFLAFSTANGDFRLDRPSVQVRTTTDARLLSKLYEAAAQATEEAIINAMIAADTMVGIDGHRSEAIPRDKLRQVLRQYSRLTR